MPAYPFHHFLFILHPLLKVTYMLSSHSSDGSKNRFLLREESVIFHFIDLFVFFSEVNIIRLKNFFDVLLFIEELIKVVDQQHVEVDLLVLKGGQCLYMLISEVILFELNE